MAGRVRGEPWPSGAKDTPGGYPHIWSEDPGPLPEEEGILGPLRLSSMPASFDLTSGSWPQHPSPQPCHTPNLILILRCSWLCRESWRLPGVEPGWPAVSGSSLSGLSRLSPKQPCLSLGGMMAFPEQ